MKSEFKDHALFNAWNKQEKRGRKRFNSSHYLAIVLFILSPFGVLKIVEIICVIITGQ